MRHPLIAARLYNTPHLIAPASAESIERAFAIAQAGGAQVTLGSEGGAEPKLAELAANGARRTDAGFYRTADGVALVPVLGPLVQRGSTMDALCGLTSYDAVGGMLDAAIEDPLVKGVLLEIDSPGGEAAGAFDLAARVRAASSVKPIVAHANEAAFSAAYALGSAAGEFYVAPTGMVGSVGVVLMHVDQSQYDAKRGVRYTPITYGERKADFNPHEPLSDAAAIAAQDMVDRLGETFVEHVASMRGIDADAVRNTQAALLHPDQALALGMVDGALSLSTAMSRLRKLIGEHAGQGVTYSRAAAAATSLKGNDMDPKDKAPVAAATVEQLAAERAAGVTEGTAAGTLAGAKAERERVKAIVTSEAATTRPALAAHLAFDSDMGAEAAIAMLGKAGAEVAAAATTGNAFDARMRKEANPDLGLDKDKGADTADAIAGRALAAARAAGGLRVVKP